METSKLMNILIDLAKSEKLYVELKDNDTQGIPPSSPSVLAGSPQLSGINRPCPNPQVLGGMVGAGSGFGINRPRPNHPILGGMGIGLGGGFGIHEPFMDQPGFGHIGLGRRSYGDEETYLEPDVLGPMRVPRGGSYGMGETYLEPQVFDPMRAGRSRSLGMGETYLEPQVFDPMRVGSGRYGSHETSLNPQTFGGGESGSYGIIGFCMDQQTFDRVVIGTSISKGSMWKAVIGFATNAATKMLQYVTSNYIVTARVQLLPADEMLKNLYGPQRRSLAEGVDKLLKEKKVVDLNALADEIQNDASLNRQIVLKYLVEYIIDKMSLPVRIPATDDSEQDSECEKIAN